MKTLYEQDSGIYTLRWSNGYNYVGQAQDITVRFKKHGYRANSGYISKLYSVWRKHGEPSLDIVERCDIVELDDAEQFYIDMYFDDEMNLNVARCAEASARGMKHSDETCAKMSSAKSGDKCHNARLTWDIVNQIRAEYADGGVSQRELGAKFGVSNVQINRIVNNKNWVV